MNLAGRIVEAEFEHRNVRVARLQIVEQLQPVDRGLRFGQPVKTFGVMREHQVALVPDELSQCYISVATFEFRKCIEGFARDARLLVVGNQRPAPAIETEHPVENPPAFERFGNVGMAH